MAVSKSRHHLNVQFPRIHRIDGQDQLSHKNNTICMVLYGCYIFREFMPIDCILVSTTCMLTYFVNEKWDKYNPDIPLYFREITENYPNEFIRSQGNSEINLTDTPIFMDENPNNFLLFLPKS